MDWEKQLPIPIYLLDHKARHWASRSARIKQPDEYIDLENRCTLSMIRPTCSSLIHRTIGIFNKNPFDLELSSFSLSHIYFHDGKKHIFVASKISFTFYIIFHRLTFIFIKGNTAHIHCFK